MALDPFAAIRLGVRAGIGLLRFELRVIEHLLGFDQDPRAPADVEVDLGPEEATLAVPVQPLPDAAAAEPVASDVRTAEPVEAPAIRIDELPATPEPDAPAHVDVEHELVGEFAEAGAEEGAGAEVRVDEPWEGYRRMRVADIRDRVAIASPAELAVIQLYESAHRSRGSILGAVERRSRELANAPR